MLDIVIIPLQSFQTLGLYCSKMLKPLIRAIKIKPDYAITLLIFSVSIVIAYNYYLHVDQPYLEQRLEIHNQIIQGNADFPYRYRVLVPFICEIAKRSFSFFLSNNRAFLLSYALYDLVSIFFLLTILYVWVRTWFSREQALIGILFVACTMPIALKDHYFQPWSLLECGLFTAGLFIIYKKRHLLLAFFTLIASLNKETAILIPFVFLFSNLVTGNTFKSNNNINRNTMLLFCIYLSIWAAVFLSLLYLRGYASINHINYIENLLSRNMSKESLLNTLVNGSLFLGIFWIFIPLGFKYAPAFIKQIAFIIPFYLITIAVWGVWYEVRLLITLYPIFVPLGLSFFFAKRNEEESI